MADTKIWKPTREQVLAARGKSVRDLIAPNLKILFCGINPGLYTAAIGHHFGRPGNRFWPAMHRAGFTARQLSPFDAGEMLALGYGVTNIVNHATATADELSREDLIAGAKRLDRKIKKFKPKWLAVVGIGAYRIAFENPKAKIGLQDETIGSTRIWVLPNPSGLNANHQPADLARLFREFLVETKRTK